MKKIIISIIPFFGLWVNAQDPHFTQFYSAPLSVNPAYSGVFTGNIRMILNGRTQWVNTTSPYKTATLSIDGKLGKNNLEGQNPLNIGILLMHDNSLNGIVQSNYVTAAGSYHIPLDEDGFKTMGIGFSATYGDRNINFSELSFSSQFSNGQFDLSIPSGEIALTNMKPFLTLGAGLLYQYANDDDGNFFDIGISCYNFNKPNQTVIKDRNQYIPVRFSVQASFQKYLNDDLLLHLKGIYQNQSSTRYYQGGFLFEKLLGVNSEQSIGAGAWYRSKDAISPYVKIVIKQIVVGITYDININELKSTPKSYRSMEVSLQFIIDKKRKS